MRREYVRKHFLGTLVEESLQLNLLIVLSKQVKMGEEISKYQLLNMQFPTQVVALRVSAKTGHDLYLILEDDIHGHHISRQDLYVDGENTFVVNSITSREELRRVLSQVGLSHRCSTIFSPNSYIG